MLALADAAPAAVTGLLRPGRRVHRPPPRRVATTTRSRRTSRSTAPTSKGELDPRARPSAGPRPRPGIGPLRRGRRSRSSCRARSGRSRRTSRPGISTRPGRAQILVIGSEGDPVTPIEGAEQLASTLEKGVLMRAPGSAHTSFATGRRLHRRRRAPVPGLALRAGPARPLPGPLTGTDARPAPGTCNYHAKTSGPPVRPREGDAWPRSPRARRSRPRRRSVTMSPRSPSPRWRRSAPGSSTPPRSACTASTSRPSSRSPIVAAVQLAWGIGVLLTSNRWVVLAGAAANTACFVGWVMAKTSGHQRSSTASTSPRASSSPTSPPRCSPASP